MSEPLVFPDKTGIALQEGDIIVYAKALGRSAGLQWALVLEIIPNKDYTPKFPTKLRVIGVEEWSHRNPELQSRAGLLQFPSRVIRMDRNRVPTEILRLLDSYED